MANNSSQQSYFICLKIDNEDLRSEFKGVYDQIRQKRQDYITFMTRPQSIHITLAFLGKLSDEKVRQLIELLEKSHEAFQNMKPTDTVVDFKGTGTFYNKVLFVPMVENEGKHRLEEFVHYLRRILLDAGFTIDNREFKPHLTMVNLAKSGQNKDGAITMDPELTTMFSDVEFGSQALNNIHLASFAMDRSTWFYQCPYKRWF